MQDRNYYRQFFLKAWQKHKTNQPLEDLEKQIIGVLLQHPEYHAAFDDPEHFMTEDYAINTDYHNPFLHLGLHLAVIEQVSTNRPAGIKTIYSKLLNKFGNATAAEHQIMPIIFDNLQQAQATGKIVDDQVYLKQLRNLIK